MLAGIRNPPELNTSICNDTGSEFQSLHLGDLQAIGLDPANPQFGGHVGVVRLNLAQGQIAWAPMVFIDMKILGPQGAQLTQLTEWFPAYAVLDVTGGARLSGNEMRHHLYFATAKGNVELYAGQTKTALLRTLPAI